MKRKVVQQGNSTLMVSLPSQWTKAHNVNKGEEIDISMHEHDLIISATFAQPKVEPKRITLTGEKYTLVQMMIINPYRAGVDELHITFSTQKQLDIIRSIAPHTCIGYEIVKIHNNICYIQNITEPQSNQLETIVLKMLFSFNELLEVMQQQQWALQGKDIVHRIYRYDNFLKRVLSKTKHPHSALFWSFFSYINQASRELKIAMEYNSSLVWNTTLTQIVEHLKQVFDLLYIIYQKNDYTKVKDIHDLYQTIIFDQEKSWFEKDKKNTIVIHHLLTALRILYLSNASLVNIKMETC